MRFISAIFVACIAALLLPNGAVQAAGAFSVDDHTLFLAHYDNGIDADFAKGDKKGAGYAEVDPEGKFGGALKAVSGAAIVDGYPRNFVAPGYRVKGNLNPECGTLEMWIKTTYSEKANPGNPSGYAFYRFMQLKRDEVKDEKTDRYKILFMVTEKDYKPGARVLMIFTGGTKSVNAAAGGFADKWTHYALTWEKGVVTLFINGTRFASMTNDNGMLYLVPDVDNDKFYIGGTVISDLHGADYGSNANSLIDELRISDNVRYTGNSKVE